MTDRITLAHGAGGELYRELVNEIFLPAYSGELFSPLNDSAVCRGAEKIAMTTDSFVIKPLFFPGGDIGRLSVCGTVNDLAVSGATPEYLSVGMIIEAGFETEKLIKITASIAETAEEAGVKIVTGDTKVVEGGSADEIFINTAGVGVFRAGRAAPVQRISEGDVIICSGCLAEHGTAIMAARTGSELSPAPRSDVKPLASLIDCLLSSGAEVHALRDPTRGGAAATLCEWVTDKTDIVVEPAALPLKPSTAEICALLGIDALFVANEGVVLAAVAKRDSDKALGALRSHAHGKNACVIAEVCAGEGRVWRMTELGAKRRVLMPHGELLPRIC